MSHHSTPRGMSNFIHKDAEWCLCFCYFPRNKQIRDEANCGKFSERYLWLSHVWHSDSISKPIFFLEVWGCVASSSQSLNFCMNYYKELKISKLKSICSVHLERPSIAKVTGTFLADVEPAQARLENSGKCKWGCTGRKFGLQELRLRIWTALNSKLAASASFK